MNFRLVKKSDMYVCVKKKIQKLYIMAVLYNIKNKSIHCRLYEGKNLIWFSA